MLSKRYAEVNQKRCVSCGACANECPREAIQIWKGCYAVINPALCVGCGKCQRTCPANCVQILQREIASWTWKRIKRETASWKRIDRETASWKKRAGMIIYGSGPSCILYWDFLIFYSRGWVWLILYCRYYWRFSAEINGFAIIFADADSFLLFWRVNFTVPVRRPRPRGCRRPVSVTGFWFSFSSCSAIFYIKHIWFLAARRLCGR